MIQFKVKLSDFVFNNKFPTTKKNIFIFLFVFSHFNNICKQNKLYILALGSVSSSLSHKYHHRKVYGFKAQNTKWRIVETIYYTYSSLHILALVRGNSPSYIIYGQ